MSDLTLAASDPIDLHMHTTVSDGHWQPADLFDYLADQRFRLVAVTDHDRADQIDEMRALGASRGIAVLAGIEVSTKWRGLTAHVLCYARDFTGDALAALVAKTARLQYENTQAVYAELITRGHAFPRRDEVLAARTGRVVLPIDNARLLVAHGYLPDQPSALAVIADAGYRMVTAPIAEAVSAAHVSGATAILAHPGRGGGEIHRYSIAKLRELLDEIPLDGLEAYYPTHAPDQVAAFEALAAERGLLLSAGSDSHGPRQRYPIAYPAARCAPLLDRLGIAVSHS